MSLLEKLNGFSKDGTLPLAYLKVRGITPDPSRAVICLMTDIIKCDCDIRNAIQFLDTKHDGNDRWGGRGFEDCLSKAGKEAIKRYNEKTKRSYSHEAPSRVLINVGDIEVEPVLIEDIIDRFDQDTIKEEIPAFITVEEDRYDLGTNENWITIKTKKSGSNRRYRYNDPIKNMQQFYAMLDNQDIQRFLAKGHNISLHMTNEGNIGHIIHEELEKKTSDLNKKVRSIGCRIFNPNRFWHTPSQLILQCPKTTKQKVKKEEHYKNNMGQVIKEKYYLPYSNKLGFALDCVRHLISSEFKVELKYPNRSEYEEFCIGAYELYVKLGLKKFANKEDILKINTSVAKLKKELKPIKSAHGFVVLTRSEIPSKDLTQKDISDWVKDRTKKIFKLFLSK